MLLDLDLTDSRVVAVGGGPVTARRVAAFLEDGARVTVIAPQVCPQVAAHVAVGAVEHAARAWDGPADLEGACLVHTATGVPAVDTAVRRAAAALGIWAIDATDAAASPVHVPARGVVPVSGGRLSVAVHAGGHPRRAVAARDLAVAALTRAAADGRLAPAGSRSLDRHSVTARRSA